MPCKNIGCAFYGGVIRCDIKSGLKPEPKRKCELDWTGLYLDSDGKAGPECAGDTACDPDSPSSITATGGSARGSCVAPGGSGLRCHNRKGHGFFLSRDSWDTF